MDDIWCAPAGHRLSHSHRRRILDETENGWVDDEIITCAMKLLKSEFPHVGGCRPSSLFYGQSRVSSKAKRGQLCWLRSIFFSEQFGQPTGRQAQILYTGSLHWVLVSNYHELEETLVYVYDSKEDPPTDVFLGKIAAVFRFKNEKFRVVWRIVDQQRNNKDCGIFAIAFLLALCRNFDPTEMAFAESKLLRRHLITCFESGTFQLSDSFPTKDDSAKKNQIFGRISTFATNQNRAFWRWIFLREKTVHVICFCRMPAGSNRKNPVWTCHTKSCHIQHFHESCIATFDAEIYFPNLRKSWICPTCRNNAPTQLS